MTVTITIANKTGTINVPVTNTANITSDSGLVTIDWTCDKPINFTITTDRRTLRFTPSANGVYTFTVTVTDNNNVKTAKSFTITVGTTTPPPITCPPGQHLENGVCVPDVITTPPPTTGTVLYDSTVHTTLHNGQAGTFTTVGNISAGGLGLECRASGNPRIRKNPDGTFSLLCDAGHGRFYGYTKNYNATMIIECAFWNKVAGQDCSLRLRSRHNEPDPCDNRFGGYGFTPDYSGWGSKREPCHNNHDQSVDGSLPSNPVQQQYFTVEYTVKDEGTGVRQIAKYNGTTVMNRVTGRQPLAEAKFNEQSYFWVRQNIDSGTGELRIKRLRILKA